MRTGAFQVPADCRNSTRNPQRRVLGGSMRGADDQQSYTLSYLSPEQRAREGFRLVRGSTRIDPSRLLLLAVRK